MTSPIESTPPYDSPRTINVLLSTFAGLSLPRTTCIPFDSQQSLGSVRRQIYDLLPSAAQDTLLTTLDNDLVDSHSCKPLSTLAKNDDQGFVSLQIRGRLCGGKGGFGSQLRAAGGRMSSRKNRNNQQDVNASNRNLDGRRIRTITEAKNLAEYLAVKPEMDRKEREERRRRWEAVIELAEKKQDELKDGKAKVRLDGDWVVAKEEVETKTRDAVMAAMRAGLIGKDNERAASETSAGSTSSDQAGSGPVASASGSSSSEDKHDRPSQSKAFFGWDEDEDEDMDSNEEEEDVDYKDNEAVSVMDATCSGKGKGKAKAS